MYKFYFSGIRDLGGKKNVASFKGQKKLGGMPGSGVPEKKYRNNNKGRGKEGGTYFSVKNARCPDDVLEILYRHKRQYQRRN